MVTRSISNARPVPAPAFPAVETVLGALSVAALVELLVLRTFTRTAVHIPSLSEMQGPYEVIAVLGRYSYYVAAVLLIVALPYAASTLWWRGELPGRVGALAAVAFAATAALARTAAVNPVLIDGLTIGTVCMAAAAAIAGRNWPTVGVVSAFAAAFAFEGAHSFLQDAASEGLASLDTRWLLWAGEWLALAFALAAPYGLRASPSRRVRIAGIAVGLATAAALFANGSTTRVLLLWNEGLAGTLPVVAYAVAAGALVMTVFGLIGQRRALAAVGVLLLVAGGVGLHSTYQSGLVIAGLGALLLSRPAAPGREPAAHH